VFWEDNHPLDLEMPRVIIRTSRYSEGPQKTFGKWFKTDIVDICGSSWDDTSFLPHLPRAMVEFQTSNQQFFGAKKHTH